MSIRHIVLSFTIFFYQTFYCLSLYSLFEIFGKNHTVYHTHLIFYYVNDRVLNAINVLFVVVVVFNVHKVASLLVSRGISLGASHL